MTTKYEVGGFFKKNLIELVEIEKETEKSIWINGRVHRKTTSYEKYFDTWEEAKDYLMAQTESKISHLSAELEKQKSKLKILLKLEKPQ
jgi:hypothetical protein